MTARNSNSREFSVQFWPLKAHAHVALLTQTPTYRYKKKKSWKWCGLTRLPQHSCSHFVPCLPVTDTEKWLGSRTCWPHTLFCSLCSEWAVWGLLVSLKTFHKGLCRTHQIKGRYELLCLNYLGSELTTGQPFLHLCMSSLWFLWVTLKNATSKPKCCDYNTCALLSESSEIPLFATHPPPPLPYPGPSSLKVSW